MSNWAAAADAGRGGQGPTGTDAFGPARLSASVRPQAWRLLMNVSTIVLDALEEFDCETAPLGLYACEEFGERREPAPRLRLEWERIAQSLSAHACHVAVGQIRHRS